MEKNNKKNFFKKHKKVIFITAGVFGSIILGFFGVKFYLKRPTVDKFLKSSSLDILKDKRIEFHDEYLQYTKNDNYRSCLWQIIEKLDKEISKREWDGKIPTAPIYHREHGHRLYKRD